MTNVSIVILNWNGKHFLKECFDSISKQSFKDFEILLVDNGSTDGSIKFIKKNYPYIRIIENKENTGFARGNNIGVEKAKGKFIVFLNNDTLVDKKWLETLVTKMKNENVGCCGSKLLYYDRRETINSIGSFLTVFGLSGSLGDGMPTEKFSESIELLAPSGGSMCIKRDLFQELGGFDSDFFAYSEDLDLGWRVWNSNKRVVFAPNSIVYHKYKISRNPKKNYLITRNTIWSIMKNASGDTVWLLPLSLITYTVIAISFIITLKFDEGTNILKGIFSALKRPKRKSSDNNNARPLLIGIIPSIKILLQKTKKYLNIVN